MRKLRTALLLVVAASAMGVLAWRWWTERGLVTLAFTNAPLSTVIKSIERQGRVEIRDECRSRHAGDHSTKSCATL